MRRILRKGIPLLFLALPSCDPPSEPPRPRRDRSRAAAPLLRPAAREFLLPSGALPARVRSVYDGDTLTLDGGRKVRLLGVDAPEISKKENLAIEARDFTRSLCEDRDVWLEFDLEKEDRYGRLLSYVYVRGGGGEIRMVNAEILREGLARFYTPGVNLRHAETLLACQREAREQGRGTWKDYVLARSRTVVATRGGKAYHREGCAFLKDSRNLRTLTVEEALDQGLSACRECRP